MNTESITSAQANKFIGKTVSVCLRHVMNSTLGESRVYATIIGHNIDEQIRGSLRFEIQFEINGSVRHASCFPERLICISKNRTILELLKCIEHSPCLPKGFSCFGMRF